MNNPEFKRNLWLSFSVYRLIGMPALLALTFIAISIADSRDRIANSLYLTSVILFIVIVWVWGAYNANASIMDELRDKTWDQQRMSALTPWTMTWGKLFGATALNWYGGIICLPVIVLSGITAGKRHVFFALITLFAIGILLHAALIALNLYISQFESRIVQRGGAAWIGIAFGLPFISMLMTLIVSGNIAGSPSNAVIWWNMGVDSALFAMNSTLLFAACTIFAAWRAVSNALQVRMLPWAWPLFACILSSYLAGFVSDDRFLEPLLISSLFVSVGMTYIALISEPNTSLRFRKLYLLQKKRDWRGFLEYMPLWPTTLLMSFLFALLIVIVLISSEAFTGWLRMNLYQPPQALTLVLMLLRDICVLLFFAFAKNNKNAAGAGIFYLIMINLLLPFLASIADLKTLRYFILPFETDYAPWRSVLIMSFHVAIAVGLLSWRALTALSSPQCASKPKTNEIKLD